MQGPYNFASHGSDLYTAARIQGSTPLFIRHMTIKHVTIGDKFKQGTHLTFEVVDFLEQTSLVSGNVTGHICIARGVDTLAKNTFEVPFSTVQRHRMSGAAKF